MASSSSSYQRIRLSRKGGEKKPLVRRYPAKRMRGRITYAIPTRRFGETKGMDTDVSIDPILATTNTNGSAFVLNLIQAGTGSWNRIGRKTHLRSVRLVGTFSFFTQPTAAGIINLALARYVIVWDKQPSGGAVPTFDQIFGVTAQDGVESCPDVTCPPRYDNMDRFKVIAEETCKQPDTMITSAGAGPATTVQWPVDRFIRLPNLESVYQSNSSPMTIADISTGALYVYFRTKTNIANYATNSFDGIARIRYTD